MKEFRGIPSVYSGEHGNVPLPTIKIDSTTAARNGHATIAAMDVEGLAVSEHRIRWLR